MKLRRARPHEFGLECSRARQPVPLHKREEITHTKERNCFGLHWPGERSIQAPCQDVKNKLRFLNCLCYWSPSNRIASAFSRSKVQARTYPGFLIAAWSTCSARNQRFSDHRASGESLLDTPANADGLSGEPTIRTQYNFSLHAAFTGSGFAPAG
jgi:hypothetical protein